MRALVALAVAATAVALGGATATSAPAKPTFLTPQPKMLTPLAAGSEAKALITVGEQLGGYRFEALPDGIAVLVRGPNKTDVWVNHETSTVPFPYVAAAPTISNSQNDFDNAQMSHLVLRRSTGEVVEGRFAIRSTDNYQRFCSSFLVGREHGFNSPLLFTNEEASDSVNRTGQAWPPGPQAEQAGLVVVYDPQTDRNRPIYGFGRMNHENAVGLPGYGHPVMLTGDDTFTAPSSQLYLYTADNSEQVMHDQGRLWAFRSDVPSINDYGDLSGSQTVSGRFLLVPEAIAKGDQTGLENWSNRENVFQFIRVEDIAYDRNHPNVVYFADTGEPRAIPDPATGRLMRGPSGTEGPYPNGRIFKIVLDPSDPTTVLSLSILINADTGGYRNPDVLHQPDNLETTASSLLVQEDPGSHNQFAAGAGPNARIWRYKFGTGSFEPVAMVDQSADPSARAGAWESSGIVDASSSFGPGMFLVDVQAHTLFIETAPGPDLIPPPGPDWLYKREGGQLLLFHLPDS